MGPTQQYYQLPVSSQAIRPLLVMLDKISDRLLVISALVTSVRGRGDEPARHGRRARRAGGGFGEGCACGALEYGAGVGIEPSESRGDRWVTNKRYCAGCVGKAGSARQVRASPV